MRIATPVTDWLIRPLAGLSTGRSAGFIVYRVHAPYTSAAREEPLGRVYRTEADARAAVAAATTN